MICLIRIRGKVKLDRRIERALNGLRLIKKYNCVLLEPTKEGAGCCSSKLFHSLHPGQQPTHFMLI